MIKPAEPTREVQNYTPEERVREPTRYEHPDFGRIALIWAGEHGLDEWLDKLLKTDNFGR